MMGVYTGGGEKLVRKSLAQICRCTGALHIGTRHYHVRHTGGDRIVNAIIKILLKGLVCKIYTDINQSEPVNLLEQ